MHSSDGVVGGEGYELPNQPIVQGVTTGSCMPVLKYIGRVTFTWNVPQDQNMLYTIQIK